MDKERIRALSLRIKNSDGGAQGSGILFVPAGTRAYIFTAAHVITNAGNDPLHIEFFHSNDCENEEDYLLTLNRGDFVTDPLYRDEGRIGFSPHDIAGAQIEKKQWMNELECFYLAVPLEESNLFCVGYPQVTQEETVEFATVEPLALVKCCNNSRIQFVLENRFDLTDIVNQLSGMSGAGLALNTTGDCEYITGIWTCSQGTAAIGSTMNGVSQNAIIRLCRLNNWFTPLTRIVERRRADGTDFINEEGEKYDDVQIRQEDELANVHDELIAGLEAIQADLFDLQIAKVLHECESLLNTITDEGEYQSEKSKLFIYRAYAYMLLGDSENVRRFLEGIDGFSVQEKGLAYIMLANDSMLRNDAAGARHNIEATIACGGEHTQALLFEKYLSLLETDDSGFESDMQELAQIARAQTMTSKEWKQYFQLCANLCVMKYDKKDEAIRYMKHAFSITADKVLFLPIAQNYKELAFADPLRPDVVSADSAAQYYNSYLECADESLRERFYATEGVSYIEILYLIRDYPRLLSCIDRVMENADDAAVHRLRFIKAHSLLETGTYDDDLINQLDESERISLLCHREFTELSAEYACYLDAKCAYEYDKNVYGVSDETIESELRQDWNSFTAAFERLIMLIMLFLSKGRNESLPVAVQLKLDVLYMYLYLKKGEMFCSLLDTCLQQYPNFPDFLNLNQFRNEAMGNVDACERTVVTVLNERVTYQTLKEAVSFYLRNTNYEKIKALYGRAMEDATVGVFHRDQLIFCYLDFLCLPKYNDAELVQAYLEYRNDLSPDQQQQMKEMIRERRGITVPD